MINYYEYQLMDIKPKDGYCVGVKFFAHNEETKVMDLNDESIGIIIKFLENLKSK
jgi:hypothetical protein